jgi:hypothetical protein
MFSAPRGDGTSARCIIRVGCAGAPAQQQRPSGAVHRVRKILDRFQPVASIAVILRSRRTTTGLSSSRCASTVVSLSVAPNRKRSLNSE